jgi:hypothetical protein
MSVERRSGRNLSLFSFFRGGYMSSYEKKEEISMLIKTNKSEIRIPNWLFVVGAVIVDNMYSNHCVKKTNEAIVKAGEESVKKGS